MTQSIHQSLMLNVLRQVSPDRLQRAVSDLVENAASITLTRTTDTEIRALVRNGEGHEYGVTLTETGVFCSCRDALYRGQTCKHATILALTVLRTAPHDGRGPPHDSLALTRGGAALWGTPSSPRVEVAVLAGDRVAGELCAMRGTA